MLNSSRPAGTPPLVRAMRAPAVRHTLIVILVLNVIVVGIKLVVGIRTNSLSVLGAALESSLDLINNLVGIALVRLAAIEPDEDHPYGHGKFETVGALGIVVFLSITCFELLREGVVSMMRGREPKPPSLLEIAAVGATMVINFFVVWFERRRAKQLASPFLLADAAHTQSDIYVTLAAVGSLILTRAGWGFVDPMLAILVALIIAWHGYEIVRSTVPVLVDERAVDAAEIRRLIGSIPRIIEVRSVRSRASATGGVLAEVTIVVDGEISVTDAHALMDEVEERIAAGLGAADVHVHVEPV
ncbi:MAG: cation diffusion facilitator family transporter [Gemmatimonadaceae bacterium]